MEPTEENLRAWEETHESLGRIVEPSIPAPVSRHLPALDGRHVLALAVPAAVGELLRAGALVTAIVGADDLRDLHAHAPGAAAVQADPRELPLELRRGRFDVVYAGDTALEVVGDLAAFAAGAAAALRPGGLFVLHDRHPLADCLDESALAFRGDYFAQPTLGAVVTAVASSGLAPRVLEEHPGFYRYRLRNRRTPGDFLLVAEKPGG
jgi:SAM-dependent methyltransferase